MSEELQKTNNQEQALKLEEKPQKSNEEIYKSVKDANDTSKNLKKSLSAKYDSNDLKYMSSLSEAVLAKSPSASKTILWLIILAVFWVIYWASQAELDERTIAEGAIIPSNKVQVIQNLEGGIVSKIYVKEGEKVKKDQILIKIANRSFDSSYGESKVKLDELNAKKIRLEAEANGNNFDLDESKYLSDTGMLNAIRNEESLFNSNKAQLKQSVEILREQVRQREGELRELRGKIAQLKSSYDLMANELNIMRPLVQKGIVSQVEFLQSQRQATQMKGELTVAELSIPRIKSSIDEYERKIKETKLAFVNKAKEELNDVVSKIAQIEQSQTSLADRVRRTDVRSPVNGTVSRIMVNTVSGVIKPGEDIVEIVPSDDAMIAEVKVQPRDVAFLRLGLRAMVKFTAYDFSIYGGLQGTVTNIGADTITNEKGQSHYLVRIETDKNHLGTDANPLPIRAGMVVSADIITGKKTVLDYILKPILKARYNALGER